MKRKIVSWIRQELKQSRAKGIVLGLSGGLDSSVVAALSKLAVGKNRVLALILPCRSPREDLKDAQLVARKLRIKTKAIDLSHLYDHLREILPAANKLTQANLKPRLRMLTLYYFANKLNYLVAGTGNKSEIQLGYFTKHGDGATDILPIGDLLKREVKKLAQELRIPEHIIAKPPTAGLWPGQTDEAEMGLTYAELDDILERRENKRKQIAPLNKLNKVTGMIKGSRHKRGGPKICYIGKRR